MIARLLALFAAPKYQRRSRTIPIRNPWITGESEQWRTVPKTRRSDLRSAPR